MHAIIELRRSSSALIRIISVFVSTHISYTAFSEQSFELVHVQARLPDDGSQRTFGYFLVVGHGDAPVRRRRLSKNYVATTLPIPLVPSFPQGFHYLAPGDPR